MSLEDKMNPYNRPSPFEILGVPPTASPEEMRDVRDNLLEDLEDKYANDSNERIRRRQEIDEAYNNLSKPRRRAVLQVFTFDDEVGKKECIGLCKKHKDVSYDFSRILKGTEDVLANEPDVPNPKKSHKQVPQDRSINLRGESPEFQQSSSEEALDSISFEK